MSNPQTDLKGSISKKVHFQGFPFLCTFCRKIRENMRKGEKNKRCLPPASLSGVSQWHGPQQELSHVPLPPGFDFSRPPALCSVHTSVHHPSFLYHSFISALVAQHPFFALLQILFTFNLSLVIPLSLSSSYPFSLSVFILCVPLFISEIPVIFLCGFYSSLLSYSLQSQTHFCPPAPLTFVFSDSTLSPLSYCTKDTHNLS